MDRNPQRRLAPAPVPAPGGLQRCVADIQRVYRSNPALYEVDFDWHGFEWLESHDNENSVFAFLRRGRNPRRTWWWCRSFTPVARYNYRVGVPTGGPWHEVLNTDSGLYGGGDVSNAGQVWAADESWAGQPHRLRLTLPPLGAIYLRPGT